MELCEAFKLVVVGHGLSRRGADRASWAVEERLRCVVLVSELADRKEA